MKKILNLIVLATMILQTGFLSGIPVSAQGAVTETPTPTLEPTKPPEPTETETATPAPVSTPTALPSATPAPIEPAPVEEITLSLSSDPTSLRRGETLKLDWSIAGLVEIAKGTLLRFQLPTEATPEKNAGTFNKKNRTLDIAIEKTSGSIMIAVGKKAQAPFLITAELLQDEKGIAKAELQLFEPNETMIESQGGKAKGLDEKVQVTFPGGALSEKVKVSIGKPSKESLPVQSLSGSPFEVTAVSENSKAEVSTFSEPVEIQMQYSEAGMTSEEDLRLYWYDPTDGYWKQILNQRVDTENNILIAYTEHFTVFDSYNSNWQTAETPTLESFQHAGFTGAASFSMPIKVPAGPGGFQPNLTLSYSSSTVDNAGSDTQASWVGMGWSLSPSYIERNGHGTNSTLDDSFSVNLNGMSMEIMKGADGKYHAADENFYKMEYDLPVPGGESASTWTIWDKSGNQYIFDTRTEFVESKSCAGYPDRVDFNTYVWRWSLTKTVNIFGKEINYSYANNTKTLTYIGCGGGVSYKTVNTYTYPSTITYANSRYRILFTRIGRTDYKDLWDSPYNYSYTAYQKSLLRTIQIIQDSNDDGAFSVANGDTLVRKYVFTYASDVADYILPDLVWEAGGRTPTLIKVQEYGLGGTNALPAYTFTYGDDMHLTSATNGYGGTVTFAYDNWNELIPYQNWGGADNIVSESEIPYWGNPILYKFNQSGEGWVAAGPYPNTVTHNSGGTGSITVTGTARNPNQGYGAAAFQPGRYYLVLASAKKTSGTGNTMRLGLRYKVGSGSTYASLYGPTVPLTGTYQTISSELIFLPENATAMEPLIQSLPSPGGSNTVDWYAVYPLPTAYRVTSRTLSTGSDSYTFTYAYEGAATNSPAISAEAAGDHPYTRAYTEFRGHHQVTETDPYGKKAVTTYYQNDCYSGRSSVVTIRDDNNNILQQTQSAYACTQTNSTILLKDKDTRNPVLYDTYFDPIKYRWVRTASETKTVPGEVAGSLTTIYDYNDNNGNFISQTVSGSIPHELITHYQYYSNTSGGKYIIGLPSRIWVTGSSGKVGEVFNVYDGDGILTTTRTLMKVEGMQEFFSQMDIVHDDWGNVTSQTAYNGYWTGEGDDSGSPSGARTMTTVYDSAYHIYPISMTTPPTDNIPAGLTTTWKYDYNSDGINDFILGVPTSEMGPNGAATKVSAEYDVFGRLTKLIRPGDDSASPTLQIQYTSTNPFTVVLTQKIQTGQSYSVTRVYDGLGRPTSATAGGVSVLYQYGFENGARRDKVSTPFAGSETYFWTKTVYDVLGRPDMVTAPDGSVTNFDYDGLKTTVTDAKGNSTIGITDMLGHTVSVDAPTGPDIAFGYDDLGRLKTAERGGAQGTEVVMNYDVGGRKIAMSDPDMGDWTYSYDALGNLKTQTDARGCVTTLQYDNLNRLTNKSYSNCPQSVANTPSVQYIYDGQQFTFDNTTYSSSSFAIGQRTGMVAGSTASAWTYDERGRPISETKDFADSSSFTTEFGYNSADAPTWMKYPDGEEVTTTYDSRMLPISVAGNANYVSSMGYDSAGRMTSRALGNGVTQKYLYKPWNEQGGRLDMMVAGTGAWDETNLNFATTLQKSDYTYDSVGNITTIADSMWGETQNFGYDSLNRLTSASATDGLANYSETYQYDPATGNLVNKNGLVLNYPTDGTRPHAVTSAGSNTYDYDDNGNQTERHIGGQTVQLGYDAENRLVSVTGTNLSAQFTYNGDGQRVKSVIGDETILFVGGHFEFNDTTNEVTKYYFAGAGRIAMRKYIVPETNTLTYLLGDHLGSTSLAVDSVDTTNVIETRYKPWGEVRFTTEDLTLPTRYTFTGQYSYISDSATDLAASASFGLMFYNARWYDPALGRFAQADTIVPGGVQGLDRYAYVNNSPVMYTDPSGHIICQEGQIASGGKCVNSGDGNNENIDSMTSDDFRAAFEIAKPGDEILYQWQGENYRLKCVTVDENGGCNLWWDLRTRQSIENPWSFASRAVGFYQLQSNGSYKVYKGIGQWQNLPEYLEPDNPEDYYGKDHHLEIRHIPTLDWHEWDCTGFLCLAGFGLAVVDVGGTLYACAQSGVCTSPTGAIVGVAIAILDATVDVIIVTEMTVVPNPLYYIP